jgi:ankyrin repeat protein
MTSPEAEQPKLVNRPFIITTEDEEDEIAQKLTAIADDSATQHTADSQELNNHTNPPQEANAIEVTKEDDNSKISITPLKKTSTNGVNFKSHFQSSSTSVIKSVTKVSKLSSFDYDATQHKKRGSGVLASTADLSASPEVFARGCNLLQLCAIGNLSEVQSFVVATFDNVNFRDYDRRTGLHVASSEGHLDVVKYLISRGAKVNRTDRWGGSPLDDAHRHRHTEVAKYLRSKGGRSGSLNLTSNLINAAASGDIEEVKMILSGFDNKGLPLDMSGSRRKNGFDLNASLTRGISSHRKKPSDIDASEPLLAGEEAFDINKGDYDKRTSLHLASSEGHYDVVEYLIKCGADVNVSDRWGGKPLDDAMQKGNKRVEALLRKHGALSAGESAHKSTRNLVDSNLRMSFNNSNKSSEAEHIDEDLRVDFSELDMIERIGSGAFGEIYKCRWRGILVAAKCIKASKIQKEWILKRNLDKSSDRVANRIEAIKQASITEDDKQLALEDFRRETAIMRRLRHVSNDGF